MLPSQRLYVQGQKWKHQSNKWDMLKVIKKDIRAMPMTQKPVLIFEFSREIKDLSFFLFDENIHNK